MIKNTCLIAGRVLAGVPAGAFEDSLPVPADPPCEADDSPPARDGAALELDGVVLGALAVFVLTAAAGGGVGVGSASDDGGSLADAEDDSDVAVLAVALALAGADAGSTTFNGERADASVSAGLEAATWPRITPKARKTTSNSADTRGAGRRRPEVAFARVSIGASGAGPAADARERVSPGWAPSLLSSRSSCGLRSPTRAPQARQ